jgi:UDP-N-acetyl-D-mannosaminuronic acid transferase (WecB/TagA/CpsF family)
MLGATEEANAEAVRVLRETYPGLQIVGRRHGYFSRDEEDELCDEINLTQPDVIWVGLSVPTEYEFAVRNKTRLKAGWLVSRRQALHGPLIANAARILESAHAAPIGIVVTN